MLALIVDTSRSMGGVLLAQNESASLKSSDTRVLGEGVLAPREFSTQLISTVAQLLEESRVGVFELDAFAVVTGPGSFTGLRVGLSAVKAMAEVTRKPIIALSSLAVLASAAALACPKDSADRAVHAVLDAGRGEFYHGIYSDAGWTCRQESFKTWSTLQASLEMTGGMVAAFEPVVLEALKVLPDLDVCQVGKFSVREALPLVLDAWRKRRFRDVATLDANYLHRMNPGIRMRKGIAPQTFNGQQ